MPLVSSAANSEINELDKKCFTGSVHPPNLVTSNPLKYIPHLPLLGSEPKLLNIVPVLKYCEASNFTHKDIDIADVPSTSANKVFAKSIYWTGLFAALFKLPSFIPWKLLK